MLDLYPFNETEKWKAQYKIDGLFNKYLERKAEYNRATEISLIGLKPNQTEKLLSLHGFAKANSALSSADLIRRGISLQEINEATGLFNDFSPSILETVETDAKYEGYLKKGLEQIEKAKKLEEKLIPIDIDYMAIKGLRLEAQQKLAKIRPTSLGQAGRISGVSPADIAVLMVYLSR